jgi:RNA polymerase sigma-70 factor (ECF subfamily)
VVVDDVTLQELLDRAHAVFPAVTASADVFRAMLERSLMRGVPLARLETTDLYLATACAGGDDRAVALCVATFFPALRPLVARSLGSDEGVDELLQTYRISLFVSGAGTGPGPGIGQYLGAGPLRGWLRMGALRLALSTRRSAVRRAEDPVTPLFERVARGNPELELLKRRHGPVVQRAVEAALGRLSRRDRHALKLQLLDGLSLEEIGRLYGVRRASVSRWLIAARARLFDEIRHLVAAELQLPLSEVQSLVRLIHSAVNLSLRRLLSPTSGLEDAMP